MRDDVKRMDRFVQRLVDKKLALPFFTLDDVLELAHAQIAAANQVTAKAKATGDARLLSQLDIDFLQDADAVLAVDTWLGLAGEGAMWWRGLAAGPDDATGGPVNQPQTNVARP